MEIVPKTPPQLFAEADTITRNKLLRFLLPANSIVLNKIATFELINTLQGFYIANKKEPNGSNSQNWCSSLINQLTSKARELEHDAAFIELAELLNLDGNLLSV